MSNTYGSPTVNVARLTPEQKRLRRNSQARKWQAAARARGYKRPRTEQLREWERNRLRTNPQFRLKNCLKARLHKILKQRNVTKKNRTAELLGCSVEFLKEYLQAKFLPGMHWNNHGPVWHIDHIKPVSSFDLTEPDEQKKAFHYTNLQPLWWADNIRKSNKLVYVLKG